MKVKKNDTVLVLTGKDAGKTGKVIASIPADNKIKVDGVNVQKKSKKARNANETSAIGAIDASNVLVVCPACGKATRVAYKLEGEKKFRVCKKCGASLDVKKAAPAPAKKTAAKKAAEPKAEGEEKKTTAKKTSTAKKTQRLRPLRKRRPRRPKPPPRKRLRPPGRPRPKKPLPKRKLRIKPNKENKNGKQKDSGC